MKRVSFFYAIAVICFLLTMIIACRDVNRAHEALNGTGGAESSDAQTEPSSVAEGPTPAVAPDRTPLATVWSEKVESVEIEEVICPNIFLEAAIPFEWNGDTLLATVLNADFEGASYFSVDVPTVLEQDVVYQPELPPPNQIFEEAYLAPDGDSVIVASNTDSAEGNIDISPRFLFHEDVRDGSRNLIASLADENSSFATIEWHPGQTAVAVEVITTTTISMFELTATVKVSVISLESGESIFSMPTEDGTRSIDWHPDGQSLLLLERHGVQTKEPFETLVSVDILTGSRTIIDFPYPCGAMARWSPDGSYIALSAAEYYSPRWELLIYDVESGGIESVDNSIIAGSPAWSNDGNRIAFTRIEESTGSKNQDVCVWSLETKTSTCIANSSDVDESVPEWSPDGQYIAYVVGDFMTGQIDIFDFEAGQVRTIVDWPYVDWQ